MHDVIVVGGGHNGLTCAAYLAKAGKRVLVLEANSHVGGFCVTEELVPEAPGYRMNSYAIDFMTTTVPRSVVDELSLHRYGLRWVFPDPYHTYLSPEGTSWSTYHSIEATCRSIARLSKRDAEYYERLMRPLMDLIMTVIPYLQDHPTRPSARTIATLAQRALKSRRSLSGAARTLLSSPLQIIDGFERDELKAYFAGLCTGGLGPLEEPNGAMFAHNALMHRVHLRRPVGGSGVFSDALAACVRDLGGEVRTSAPVREILVGDDAVEGVVLESGEEIRSAQVVAAVDPTTLFTRLVDESVLPEEVRKEVRDMQIDRYGIGQFKGDMALSRRPSFPMYDLPDDHFHSLIVTPSVECVQGNLEAALRGEIAGQPTFYFGMPSISDRSLVPPGSEGEVGYLYPLTPPLELADGRKWTDEVKSAYLDTCLAHLEEYAPGIRDSVIGQPHTRGPGELNAPWAYKGAIWGVDVVPSQMGPWRPSPSLAGYRSPVDGLWHTGPGAHPLPGVCGWSGRTTAHTLLKEVDGRLRSLRRGLALSRGIPPWTLGAPPLPPSSSSSSSNGRPSPESQPPLVRD